MSAKRATAKTAEKPEVVTKAPAVGKTTSVAALAAMSPQALSDEAKAWDDARAVFNTVTEAAAAAQVALDGLPADASDDAKHDALVLLAEAENAVRDAEARVEQLTSSNLPVGAASATAHGGNASVQPAPAAAERDLAEDAVRSSATHTPQSESDDVQDGAGREAGPAGTYRGTTRAELSAMAGEQADIVIASVRAQILAGNREGALLHLKQERLGAEFMMEAAKLVADRLDRADAELRRSLPVWPLENVMYGGDLHFAGGPSFGIDPDEFEGLQSIGVVTDRNPHATLPEDRPGG